MMKSAVPGLSLRTKFVLFNVVLCIVVLSIALGLMAYSDFQLFKRELEQSANTETHIAGIVIGPAVMFNDSNGVYELLDTLIQKDDRISAIAVYDKAGKQTAAVSVIRSVDYPSKIAADGSTYYENHLEVWHTIETKSAPNAYIWIRFDFSQRLAVRQAQYIATFLLAFGISTSLALMLVLFLRGTFFKPLQELTETAKKISQTPDYSQRIEHHRNDEIGLTLDAFNQMLDVIKNRDEKLKENSEKLEQLVHLRTRQLHQRANYDALTSLPNRHLLLDRLRHEIHGAHRTQTQLGLMFLDLDRFKVVNDNLGHQTGDYLLIEVANRLKALLREDDTIGRLGGDEFVILLRNIKHADNISIVAQEIIKALQMPFRIQDHILHISTSIGIAIYPKDGEDADTLMKRADSSMYQAKQRGVGLYAFYENSLEQESKRRLSLETQLRQALENDEFELVFHPQHETVTHEFCGAEALLRWHNSDIGVISPARFIPLAEEIGLINRIGVWVMERTCHHMQTFQKEFPDGLKISINISAQHLMQANFTQQVISIVEASQIPPHLLEIEITEETFLRGAEQIKKSLSILREMGMHIAIDDFGTGYSSLSYLRNFPVDTLKLDGSFIEELERNEADRGIVSASITLGHSLGLKIVAECVETIGQLESLTQQQCDIIQGYYFSRPLPAPQLIQYRRDNTHALRKADITPNTTTIS